MSLIFGGGVPVGKVAPPITNHCRFLYLQSIEKNLHILQYQTTLRIQILSESHPTSLASQKGACLSLYYIKEKGSVLPSILCKDQTTAKSKRRKVIHKMAELAAKEI
jgi:hypothetical protein